MRVASNLLVMILLLACVAYGIDAALVWYGTNPYFSCEILPAWLDLSDPWALLVAPAALVLWGISRSRAALLLFLVALMIGVLPWILMNFVDPSCS